MCIHPKTYKKLALQVGALFAGLAVLCFIWPIVRGLDAELSTLHMQLWSIAFVGYTGFNITSLIAAVVQSFIWGVIAVGVWRLAGICCSASSRKGGASSSGGECCKTPDHEAKP